MPDRRGAPLGVLDDLLAGPARLADELVLLDHALGPHPGGIDQALRFVRGPLDHLVALLQEPAGLAQLLGKAVDRVLQDRAELVAVDRHRCRHGQLAGRLEDVPELLEQRGRVGDLAGFVLEHRHTSWERNGASPSPVTIAKPAT